MRASPVNRTVFLVLLLLMCVLQYQIWNGRASIGKVGALRDGLEKQQQDNRRLEADIARLHSEIDDLRNGLATVEEKARFEMGMVRPNEVFVQIAH